jgi:cysteine-rich repeat protein
VAFCGDGYTNDQTVPIEACDDGGLSADCDLDCTISECGDGFANPLDGEQCDTDGESTTCDTNCTIAFCGDSTVNAARNEACDRGGNHLECDADCTLPDCGDGHTNPAFNEECDDGNEDAGDGCNECRLEVCGDGVIDSAAGEVCDDGNTQSGDGCRGDCSKYEICGDSVVDQGETCDDGNDELETECPYGQATCNICDNNCQTQPETGNVCGDGAQDPDPLNEECDDGNTILEDECEYGDASCQVCDGDCQLVDETGNVCGDGVRDTANEACDDNNTATCGTCGGPTVDTRCTVVQSARATGLIVAIRSADIVDGETFTINDGKATSGGAGQVVFEFDKGGGVGAGNTAVTIGNNDSASNVRDDIRDAIDGHGPLRIDADSGAGSNVNLTHLDFTSLGNVAISENVVHEDFGFTGMSGGAGGDCTTGVECQSNADCVSNVCLNGSPRVCQ